MPELRSQPRPTAASARARLRRALLVAIGILYVFSIPWYRTPGADAGLLLGLPGWVTVALACYVLAAILNAIAWLLTEVPDPNGGARPPDAPSGNPGEDSP